MSTRLYAVQQDNQITLSVVLRSGPASTPTPLDLTSATAVRFLASGPADIDKACSFVNDETGAVTVDLVAADLAEAGGYNVQWKVTFSDSTVISLPDPGYDSLLVTGRLS